MITVKGNICWNRKGWFTLIGLFPPLLIVSLGHFLKLLMLLFFLGRTVSRFLKDTGIMVGPIRISREPPVKSIVSTRLCKQISMTSPRSSPTLQIWGGKIFRGESQNVSSSMQQIELSAQNHGIRFGVSWPFPSLMIYGHRKCNYVKLLNPS